MTWTIIFHPYNGQHYVSPARWNDANYAIGNPRNRAHFRNLTSGERATLKLHVADWPDSPGEYCEVPPCECDHCQAVVGSVSAP